jgi:hypothetical protein
MTKKYVNANLIYTVELIKQCDTNVFTSYATQKIIVNRKN